MTLSPLVATAAEPTESPMATQLLQVLAEHVLHHFRLSAHRCCSLCTDCTISARFPRRNPVPWQSLLSLPPGPAGAGAITAAGTAPPLVPL